MQDGASCGGWSCAVGRAAATGSVRAQPAAVQPHIAFGNYTLYPDTHLFVCDAGWRFMRRMVMCRRICSGYRQRASTGIAASHTCAYSGTTCVCSWSVFWFAGWRCMPRAAPCGGSCSSFWRRESAVCGCGRRRPRSWQLPGRFFENNTDNYVVRNTSSSILGVAACGCERRRRRLWQLRGLCR